MKNDQILINILKEILSEKTDLKKILQSSPQNYFYKIPKNETIINIKESVDYIYFLLQGNASVWGEVEWANNIIAYVEPLEILGLLEVLTNIDYYTAFVLAETDCTIFKISKNQFISLLQQDASLCYKTLKVFGKMTSKNMEEAALKRLFTQNDIIGYYFYLQSRHKIPYVCYYTRNELSEILNINLRTLYRHIFSLEKEGYLTIKKGKIIILEENFKLLTERYKNINI